MSIYRTSILVATCLLPLSPGAAASENLAFAETFMIRLASYSVQDADTDIAVFSTGGVGAGYSFADDLGGDERVTIPRIDGYYRFNDRHRIEFASMEFERDGRELLEIEIEFEDQTYSVGDILVSDIDYGVFKLAYGYTFYHSPRVELGVTAGLNVTSYDFNFQRDDGSQAESSDVTAPLPMFGLRVSFAINQRWSLHYLSESFYIDFDDSLTGSFTNTELDVHYRLHDNFLIGAGSTRFSTDFSADDSDWRGRIADTHRGLLVFGSYYF